MIVILAGAKRNIGDYLIVDRATQLLLKYVDEDIVKLDRFQPVDEHLETINKAKCLILCGGPAYARNIYPGVYPIVDDLSKVKVPIVPFGLGWAGSPMNHPEKFRFDDQAAEFLKRVHGAIETSSCRDVLTESVVKQNGFENVTMTGCPVWYHLDSIGKEFEEKSEIKKVVITTPASQKLVKQTLKVVRLTKKQFPGAKLYLSFHRGIFPGKGTGYRKSLAYISMCIGAFFIKPGIKVTNVAHDLRRLDYYDGCDFHIGYRVHAHLYFLSKRMPSVLINEDGRGRGQVLSMNLPELNIDDPELLTKVDKVLSDYKKKNFKSFKAVGKFIDARFEVMKDFLKKL